MTPMGLIEKTQQKPSGVLSFVTLISAPLRRVLPGANCSSARVAASACETVVWVPGGAMDTTMPWAASTAIGIGGGL